MNISQKLKLRREELALTQSQVADKLYVSRQAVSNWESGQNYPDLETLLLISNVYDISVDELLKENPKEIKKIEENIVKKYLEYFFIIIGIFAAIVCLIIDFSVTKRISWSSIVVVSIMGMIIGWYIIQKVNRNKEIKFLLWTSFFIQILLITIQFSLFNGKDDTFFWLWPKGMQLSILWLVIIWIVFLIKKYTKIKLEWYIFILCILEITGNILTKYIAMDYSINSIFALDIYLNILIMFIVGVTSIILIKVFCPRK